MVGVSIATINPYLVTLLFIRLFYKLSKSEKTHKTPENRLKQKHENGKEYIKARFNKHNVYESVGFTYIF
jgi:hypothetical protein